MKLLIERIFISEGINFLRSNEQAIVNRDSDVHSKCLVSYIHFQKIIIMPTFGKKKKVRKKEMTITHLER